MQSDINFDNIASEIINTKRFKELNKEPHHGISRYKHVMRVSKFTYKITKFLKMDYISATRGALLHDYFTKNDVLNLKELKKGFEHPNIALNNANNEFILNDIEKNAIVSHMFPLGKVLPKYKESWILTIVDKFVAVYEMSKFKLTNALTIYILFFSNMILFGQK